MALSQRSRKGQIGQIETVLVLVVFFFLLATGLMIYRSFARQGDISRSAKALEIHALSIAQFASTLPELQCSSGNVMQDNCVDLLKAQAFAKVMAANQGAGLLYADIFQFANISVERVYPDPPETYNIYSREPSAGVSSKEVIQYPIIIYNPLAGRGTCMSLSGACDFGMLVVEVYR